MAAGAGLVGCSIEDSTNRDDDPIYSLDLSVERIRAAVEQARETIGNRIDEMGLREASVMTRDTDVIYVLEGRATVVTGGTVGDAKTTAPDELRGARIEGGTPRTLAKGDVLIVPEGVPHWFSEVKGPLLYYVVKVTQPAGAMSGAATASAAAMGGAR